MSWKFGVFLFCFFLPVNNNCHFVSFQKLASECLSEGLVGILLPFKCDLMNEEEILSMFAAIKQQHGGVDVCINNAGLAHPDPLLSGTTSGWRSMLDVRTSNGELWPLLVRHKQSFQGLTFLTSLCRVVSQVNVLALSICTREAYQSMKERNVDDGQIININRWGFITVLISQWIKCPAGEDLFLVSFCLTVRPQSTDSMSGHRIVHSSDTHFYSCTKFAVTALTEGLRQELREANSHIRATVRATLCRYISVIVQCQKSLPNTVLSGIFACRVSLLVWCKLNLRHDSILTTLRKLLRYTLSSR